MQDFRLYVIVDPSRCQKDPIKLTREIIDFADIIQLRYKNTNTKEFLKLGALLKKIIKRKNKLFIINDRPDIAKIIGSDGVHLGQDDLLVSASRLILGKHKIIGKSCHNLKQALDAQKENVDYISIGPIFRTTTKPEYKAIGLNLITQIKNKIKIPYLAIGGINKNNIQNIINLGLKRVAVCSCVCQTKKPGQIALELKNLLK